MPAPSLSDILLCAATGVRSDDMTLFDVLRAQQMQGGGKIKTLTGVPPLPFKANGKPLISLSMLGNTQQTGTPSPQSIIMPDFCGKLVGTDWTIPITCAGQTTSGYLGQAQTVRKVKKLVLTGEESFYYTGGGFYLGTILPDYKRAQGQSLAVCTHYPTSPQTGSIQNVPDMSVSFSYGTTQRLYVKDTRYGSSYTDFKTWLAAQYAAGTPVVIWYVLAAPKTDIVNEPLCKIGDYADELHSEDAGITIPTIKGQNTLTVDTDLQPSSVTIIYK